MGIATILFLSFGVAMDAFAVSITNVLCYEKFRPRDAFLSALTFGGFQAFMPLIGYYMGSTFYDTIAFLDHWIAFLLLGAIGANMISEGIKAYRCPNHSCETERFTFKILLAQAIATSIDALALGISFALIRTNIFLAVSLIGITTFLFSLFGSFLGKKFDQLLKNRAQIFGGGILIFIGFRILVEHLFA
ncbi:MAG: putative manganese efflux pump MntP [Lachnoclostridium sp.]|jgi:manganese efflux pump family protein